MAVNPFPGFVGLGEIKDDTLRPMLSDIDRWARRVSVQDVDTTTGLVVKIRTVLNAYTLQMEDTVLLANGTFTVTLPPAGRIAGKAFRVKNIGVGVITVDAVGSETIDGALTAVLALQYDSIDLTSDHSNWHIV